jgi:glycosyltransferase involved in cell wall biosynthesis
MEPARSSSEGADLISFVIPAKDEAESLPRLHGELAAVADAEELEIEILFIDDGSTDGTWEAIQAISASDPRVRGIRFRRNFGKAAGLSAGFAEARGQIIFTMDADLQDDPAEVPRFLKALDGGLDVVSGWKRTRHDPWHKVLPSRAWNAMVSWATGVSLHDHNCGFKAYRRAVIEEVDVYGEFHRYIPPLARARGFRVGEVEVHHRPREHGSSKYGARRFVRGFIDLLTVVLLTKARHRPAHLFGGWGLSFIALSAGLVLLWLICAAGGWIPRARGVIGWIGGLGMGLGITFLAMGLLAQMMLAVGGGGRDQFAVVERIGEPDPED